MKSDSITRYKPDPNNPPKTDWTAFDARTEAENTAAALADPDAQPWTPEKAARARRIVRVKLIRDKFGLSQEAFAKRFGIPLDKVQAWESGTTTPDKAEVTLLRVIWAEPEAVRRVVAAE